MCHWKPTNSFGGVVTTVQDINDFDGAIGDKTGKSWHCLNAFIMNNQIYVIEPQDQFPKYVLLDNYPNNKYIARVDFQ